MADPKLAIVIPAYKATFLEDCLCSICNQKNKNFTVYIGDDASNEDLASIVSKYQKDCNLVYYRFDENIGEVSLTKQWERCVGMTGEEEWIWLFADDDMMDPECVEVFIHTANKNPDCNVIRFNLQVIDPEGKVLRTTVYPAEEPVNSFLMNRFSFNYDSPITNYVFRRKVYNQFKFKEFPLAWCSDEASIANFASKKPIITVDKSFVQWRASSLNITTGGSHAMQKQKVYARLEYIKWLYSDSRFPFVQLKANKKIILLWMVRSIKGEFKGFSGSEKKRLLQETSKIIGITIWFFQLKKSLMYIRNRARSAIKLSPSKA